MSAKDYPEHLNPFDDNYTGAEPPVSENHKKYNTWSAPHSHKVSTLSRIKPTIFEKPWAALNISPNGKLVRRLSLLKTTVARFTTKNKRLSQPIAAPPESELPARSYSFHEDFNFRIVSPKVKERIRQQAFSKPPAMPEDANTLPNETPIENGRLTPTTPETEEPTTGNSINSPASPDSEKELFHLGARPKTRKKRPPPPPPVEAARTTTEVIQDDGVGKTDGCRPTNGIVLTQDLDNEGGSDEGNSRMDVKID